MKHYKELYGEAYAILGELTPLKTDCGVLCDAACCKGDANTGMRLFPNEECTLSTISAENVRLCVCGGSCKRCDRPLACRIFPLFPVLHSDGHISAEIDTRAVRLCPLAENCDKVKFDKNFVRAVRKVGRLLCSDPECREFIKETSAEIKQYSHLLGFSKYISKRK